MPLPPGTSQASLYAPELSLSGKTANILQAGTFLIDIAADICHKTDENGARVLSTVEDKVVQDITGEEGTGIWSNTEAVEQHIPAPTLSSAHFLRLVSADRDERTHVRRAFGGQFPPSPQPLQSADVKASIEDLRLAVYTASLASFVQGISVIDRANRQHGWDINYSNVLQIWRAGCIIRADYIADVLSPILSASGERRSMNLLTEPRIAAELQKGWAALKRVVSCAISADFVVPTLSSTLEYLKYSGSLGKCACSPPVARELTQVQTYRHSSTRRSWITSAHTCMTAKEKRITASQSRVNTTTSGSEPEQRSKCESHVYCRGFLDTPMSRDLLPKLKRL